MKSDRFCEILREISWKAELSPSLVPLPNDLECGKQSRAPSPASTQLTFFQVTDEKKRPLLATLTLEHLPDGAVIDFFKTHTNRQGYTAIRLEEGRWRVTASKGGSYSVHTKEVDICRDQAVFDLSLTDIRPEWMHGWMAGDLHHHSVYSSRLFGGTDPVTESPEEVKASMQAAGLQFGALSDHHNTLNHSEWQQCESPDFLPILSKEISTSAGHVLSLNVPEDTVFQIPKPENRTDSLLRQEFLRVTTAIRQAGGLAQLNHPCDRQKAISWNPAWMDLIHIFDTLEIWNGSKPLIPGTSSFAAVEMWLDLLEQGIYLPATTGSDTHNTHCDDYSRYCRVISAQDCEGKTQALQWKQLLALFGRWQQECLGSGGVFTLVRSRTFTAGDVLHALKQGASVLSSGPLLLPVFGSAGPGEHGSHTAEELVIHLRSNRPLDTLSLVTKGHHKIQYSLASHEIAGDGYWEYSHILTSSHLKELGFTPAPGDWLVVLAADRERYTAISNPIFLD